MTDARLTGPSRAWVRAATVGFLMLGVLPRAGQALDSEVTRALDCADERRRAESDRGTWLSQAESLGVEIARAEAANAGSEAASLRSRAVELQQRAMTKELDLLSLRDRCRKLADAGLKSIDRRLSDLDGRNSLRRNDGARTADAAELLELQRARAELEAERETPAVLSYPDLVYDPNDPRETLLAKIQYYQDIRSYLDGVDARLERRLDQLRDEARALEEASRFLRDLAFVDEAGRVSADGTVRVRGLAPDGNPGEGGTSRGMESLPGGREDLGLDLALRWTPTNAADSERVATLLRGFRREIERERERIARQIASLEAHLEPAPGRP